MESAEQETKTYHLSNGATAIVKGYSNVTVELRGLTKEQANQVLLSVGVYITK